MADYPFASSGQPSGTTGIYIPSDWGGRGWHAALANAGSSLARVAVAGDSVARGYYASSLRATGFMALLNTALQAAYGSGGSGWHGSVDTAIAGTALGVNASAITAYGTSGDYWTVTGTWTVTTSVFGDFQAGPGGFSIQTTDAVTPGSVTVNVTGSTVKVFTVSNSGSHGSWHYQVDGGTAVPVTDGSGFNVQVTTISTGSTGSHAIKITYTDAGTNPLQLIGLLAYNPSGVVVKNYAYYGSTAWLWNNSQIFNFGGPANTSAGPVGSWSGGSNDPSDLVIVHSAGNDATALINTNVGFASNASADGTSIVLNNYLPPGKYGLFNGTHGEMAVLGYPTIANSQYTYSLPNSLVYAYTTGNGVVYGATWSPDVWETNIRQYLSDVLDGQSQAGTTDIIIVMQHIGTYETSLQGTANQHSVQYQDYLARARGLAEEFGAALVDLWAIGHNSWNWANAKGYWANPASPGAAGTDVVHLSNAGHAWAAAQFQSLILNQSVA